MADQDGEIVHGFIERLEARKRQELEAKAVANEARRHKITVPEYGALSIAGSLRIDMVGIHEMATMKAAKHLATHRFGRWTLRKFGIEKPGVNTYIEGSSMVLRTYAHEDPENFGRAWSAHIRYPIPTYSGADSIDVVPDYSRLKVSPLEIRSHVLLDDESLTWSDGTLEFAIKPDQGNPELRDFAAFVNSPELDTFWPTTERTTQLIDVIRLIKSEV